MPATQEPTHRFDRPHAPTSGTALGLRCTFADGQATLLAQDTGGGSDGTIRIGTPPTGTRRP